MSSSAEWIAVDWGTSNLRAWGIGAAGGVAFARNSDQGMGKLTREQYPGVLTALLADEMPEARASIDVLICGMAGARQGWLEAPYLEAPANLGSLGTSAVAPDMAGSRLNPRILPGVCQMLTGSEDVMRGEETQLLGLSALLPGFSGLVIMPGTHSKWAVLEGMRVMQFSTSMTGELFELLKTHSVLRHSLDGSLEGEDRDIGFAAGAAAGLESPQRLEATLFKVRAASLLSGRSPAWSAGYLSGLLIGSEIGGQRAWIGTEEIPLIGGVGLANLYAQVLTLAGARSRVINATEATLAGLKLARSMT